MNTPECYIWIEPGSHPLNIEIPVYWRLPEVTTDCDWIGIYKRIDGQSQSKAPRINFVYATGDRKGNTLIRLPDKEGKYEIRYFLENYDDEEYDYKAVSDIFSVSASAAPKPKKGFFENLFGKNEEQVLPPFPDVPYTEKDESPPLTGFKKKFYDYAGINARNWDDIDEEKKYKLGVELLNLAGLKFDESTHHYEVNDDDEIQIRGIHNNFPVRITLNVDSFRVEMAVKVTIPDDSPKPTLEYNLNKIPKERASQTEDTWAAEDEIRAFVEKGFYFESNDREDIEEGIAFWNGISDGLREILKRDIPKYNIEMLNVLQDTIEISYWNKEEFLKTEDPAESISGSVILSTLVAKELEGIKIEKGNQEKIYRLVVCSYCSTKFPLDGNAACVNCGAGYQG